MTLTQTEVFVFELLKALPGFGVDTINTTERELKILRLIFEGLTNREIGERLYLSPYTVRNYISLLLIKFEARNRTNLLLKFVTERRHHHRRLFP